ncbi:MAG: KGG domain-containing protein, partial [Candidatus Binatia bacterium]
MKQEDKEKQRDIASQGGHASTGSFGDQNSPDPKKA